VSTPSDTYADFLARYPEYQSTLHLDALRDAEYGRLDEHGHIYLDYTGAGLHAASQVRLHAELLNAHALGNPHSASPSSSRTTVLVEGARRAVLEWFNAARDYTAVFTANATGALKHVGESYPFTSSGRLLLSAGQSQLGQRHSRVREERWNADRLRPADRARAAARSRGAGRAAVGG
jgi:selenocysteine lyase/cysteine desulfurase